MIALCHTFTGVLSQWTCCHLDHDLSSQAGCSFYVVVIGTHHRHEHVGTRLNSSLSYRTQSSLVPKLGNHD